MNSKTSKKLRKIIRTNRDAQLEAIMRHLKKHKPKLLTMGLWLKLIQWVLNR